MQEQTFWEDCVKEYNEQDRIRYFRELSIKIFIPENTSSNMLSILKEMKRAREK